MAEFIVLHSNNETTQKKLFGEVYWRAWFCKTIYTG